MSELIEPLGTWQPIETAPKDGTEILLALPLRWPIHEQNGLIGTGYVLRAAFYDAYEEQWRDRLDSFYRENSNILWIPLPCLPSA